MATSYKLYIGVITCLLYGQYSLRLFITAWIYMYLTPKSLVPIIWALNLFIFIIIDYCYEL